MAKKKKSTGKPKVRADSDGPPVRRCCGTMEVHERLLRTAPGYREARDACENHAWRAALSPMASRTGCTKIPVVVHVVYRTAAQNISNAQIDSQIDVLNDDFRKKNADVSTVPAVFSPLADDARIIFELADTDPDGNPTDGIVRVSTSNSSFSADLDDIKSTSTNGADAWPADKYLNIWVAPRIVDRFGNSLLGYAQFPGGPADTDGVVILHSAFGNTGTAAAPFDLGRTATHEIGHWLNLRHIWGDDGTGCSGSDFVADTPNQGGPNVGKPTFPSVSCSNGPNGDMFMNYMDYVDDDTMVMFSTGQVARMQAALDGPRSTIGTAVSCGPLTKPPPQETVKPLKEFPKELIKEWIKDIIKDLPKDLPKDPPKELPKELHKDPGSEPPKKWLEPPKGILEPPKGIFEGPKGIFEGMGGLLPFPFFGGFRGQPGGPGGAWGGTASGGGGMPYVLATPTGAAGGGGCGCGGGAGGAGNAPGAPTPVAEAYLQLLGHYAMLHQQGGLNAEDLAAWQAVAHAYRQATGM
jgi:hypothetical protein